MLTIFVKNPTNMFDSVLNFRVASSRLITQSKEQLSQPKMVIFHLILWCGNFGILQSVLQILLTEVTTYIKRAFCRKAPRARGILQRKSETYILRPVGSFAASLTNH